MSGAGGRPKPKHFKRQMITAGGATGGGARATEADADEPAPPPDADAAAPANPDTPPPAKKGVKGRGTSVGVRA